MPKHPIERQYLLPVNERLIVEAADPESARRQAIEAEDCVDQEKNYDAASTPTIHGTRQTRVVESGDPVNFRSVDGRLVRIEPKEGTSAISVRISL